MFFSLDTLHHKTRFRFPAHSLFRTASDEECLRSEIVQEAFQDALVTHLPCGKKIISKDDKTSVKSK